MNGDAIDHGPRLSDAEYEQRVVALQRGQPALPDAGTQRRQRRQALDLSIDHRLGVDFPADRREALWQVAERVERRRLWFGLSALVRRWVPGALDRGGAGLAGAMIDAYAEVLTPAELQRYFDLPPGGPGRSAQGRM